ncbi:MULTISPECIES: HAD family hydrolase [Sphingobacterium]|uniref:HAD family phosphatase n=1 Tax=Sphingobacterium tenebrionis TaxID=3111775 RepID=A0ABU8I335_9SPHI|nr:HAD family phosphatase [Sphingobacterium sp. CZ-2]QBR11054.1 HAD family phosphatase [Sphingobacterium sp. CZ-2]
MRNINAVLFDMDGTLIDSEYFYFSNWAPILKSDYDFEIDFDDWIRDFAGHTLKDNVEMLNREHQLQVDEEDMWFATRANYAKANMKNIRLMPHAKEILEKAKAEGLTLGLVTSSYQTTVQTVLGEHQLLDYFSFFVTRELVESPKPNPEPYLLAVEKLNIPKEEIVVIEDTSTGCTAAKDAGLYCIAVSKQAVERQRLNHADLLLNDLAEVKNSLF